MRIRIGFAVTLAFVLVLALGSTGTSAAPAAAPSENAVVYWSGIAEVAIAAGRPPASSTPLAAMVHGAMYDAVAAVERGLEPFATGVTAPPEASADAAVAQAARDVLVARVPGQVTAVQVAYDTFMASIPAGPAKDGGKAVGTAAAAGMLAMRTGDHFDDVVPYVQPTPGPGVFEPIAPTPPVDVKLGKVRPFTFDSPSKYRPGKPYELTSKRYARDVNELKEIGGVVSARMPFQTEHARFFSDQAYAQYSRAVRGIAVARGLDLAESARLLGYVWVAAADTMIACWEAKYHYYFWRPNHAIQRAGTDGNPDTSPDPTWLPLLTGNHPEYPSGHACLTAAITQSLKGYFGTKRVQMTFTSNVVGAPKTYATLDDVVAAIEDARVWGGLHYRTTMTETAKHFPRIARDVGRQFFLEHEDDDEDQDEDD
ncbi:MAG TPA: vanadium-dependent haloperoxidase [Gaiellaceae bacterium]|nr:vanadium-dependent haloperoxidase [Gaiellaceae bacterium]